MFIKRKGENMKRIIYIVLGLLLFTGTINGVDNVMATTPAVSTPVKTVSAQQSAITVSPLDVVKTPQKYLNKTIIMNATFDKFSTLGLDYKPAMRSSEKYIGILVKRDDVIDHTVPLSEMKMFLNRDMAEKNINLESEDKVQITGKVFSTALGDPWIDIKEIKVVQKAPKKENKK